VMSTWREGRQLVFGRLSAGSVPLSSLAGAAEAAEARVSGTAVYFTTRTEDVPVTFLNNLKHNKVLHRCAVRPGRHREHPPGGT